MNENRTLDVEPETQSSRLADLSRPLDETDRGSLVSQPPAQPRQQVIRETPQQTSSAASALTVVKFSDECGELFGALANAQGEFGEIERTLHAKIALKAGGNYEYDYAPLDEVLQAVRPSLSKNGIAIMQFPHTVQGRVIVRTMIAHKSGQWMHNDLVVVAEGQSAREIGSAVTYARRYAIMSMLGVAPAYDDDGGGNKRPERSEPPRASQRRSAQPEPSRQNDQKPAGAGSASTAGQKPAGPSEQPTQAPTGSARPSGASGEPRSQKPADGAAEPKPIGKIASVEDRGPAHLVTLETGFRASTKDPILVSRLNAMKADGSVAVLSTEPSADPSKYAPRLTGVAGMSVVARTEREPGEEG